MKSRNQSGFTLVEIAIVLVVIGLLLGGILKGQQLINSARVRNMADQNSAVQSSYYGFIDRFRNLPGDMDPVDACNNIGSDIDTACGGTPTIGGDGNGRIDDIVEAGAVWAHLSVAGFLTGTYTGDTSTAAAYNTGVPDGAVPPNAFQGPIMLAHTSSYKNNGGVIRLAYSFGGNIPVPLLRDLDQKLDDGAAGTGVLRSSVSASDSVNASEPADFTTVVSYDATVADCVGGTAPNETWDVDSSNQDCNGMFLY
jgi:prepilin-type N-terminal cleavage/methylation domain-containing protein